jgi:hypothetical protein
MTALSPYLPDAAHFASILARAVAPAVKSWPSASSARAPLRFPRLAAPVVAPGATWIAPRPLAELDEADGADIIGSENSDQTLEDSLDALLLWLAGSTGAFAAFVADSDGLALANRHAPETYLVAAAALGAADRAMCQYVTRPTDGGTIIDLEGSNVLHILWVTTSAGRLAVGLVLGEPLPRELAEKARRLLRSAVERKGFSR